MKNDLCTLTATEMIAGLKARKFSARELLLSCLSKVDALESTVNAWAWLDKDVALKQADALDAKQNQSQSEGGRLFGLPVGVKDVFNTKEMPCAMGSPIWEGFTPGNDARVVHYMKCEDAVMMGKTVSAEFAVHAPGPTKNPHHPEYMPGTSSSGSAAAVAAFMVPVSLGTQTAGSILRPASYCGVVGYKPSFGVVPRTGVLKTTDSLDTVGLLGRSIEDVELCFDIIRVRGRDYPLVANTLDKAGAANNKPGKNWKVAFVTGPKWSSAEPYAQQSIKALADKLSGTKGFSVEEVELPALFSRAHEVHGQIYHKTLAYYFKDEFKKGTLISPVLYEMIEHGDKLTLADYTAALAEQRSLAKLADEMLSQYDVIINLTTGGEALKGLDSVDRPDNCLIWTMCHLPAMTIPVFSGPNGLPFGAQFVGRRFADYNLLACVKDIAKCIGFETAPHPVPKSAGVDLSVYTPNTGLAVS